MSARKHFDTKRRCGPTQPKEIDATFSQLPTKRLTERASKRASGLPANLPGYRSDQPPHRVAASRKPTKASRARSALVHCFAMRDFYIKHIEHRLGFPRTVWSRSTSAPTTWATRLPKRQGAGTPLFQSQLHASRSCHARSSKHGYFGVA